MKRKPRPSLPPVKHEQSPDIGKVPKTPNPKRRADETTGVVSGPAKFPWRECEELADEERLKIKEKAIVQAEKHCKQIRKVLDSALNIPPDSPEANTMGVMVMKQWCAVYEKVLDRHKKRQILVGVEGPTGAGKSSLLGSLLKIPELFPSGQESAATAVIGKVSWNWVDNPGREFRAEVTFRPTKEISSELKDLLEELNRWSNLKDSQDGDKYDDGEIAEELSEVSSTIEQKLPWVHAVWGISKGELVELADRCPQEVSYKKAAKMICDRNTTATKFLKDGRAEFGAATAEKLSEHIKPFLDSSSCTYGGASQFSAWPLVKEVHIFAKADILKPGITLVDLPGCGDVIESRSEVAHRMSHTLDVRMVVSPIIRATDEKQGQALMQNGFDEAQMRIRGKMDGRGFCVVASKMDDMKVDSYINGCPELAHNDEVIHKRNELAEAKEEKATLENQRVRLKADKKQADSLRRRASASYESAKKTHRSNLQNDSNASDMHLSALRAKLDEQIQVFTAADERLEDCEQRQTEVATEITYINDWIHHRAIQTRNARVIKRLRADFVTRQRRMDNDEPSECEEESEYVLPILPVSTRAFWQLENNDTPMAGFPDHTYTGIPAVEKWIHQATLAKREKHLDETLDGYQSLMTMMRIYSSTRGQDGNFNFTRSEVDGVLADTHEFYARRLCSILTEACEEIHKLNPLEHKERAKKSFLKEAQNIVKKWEHKYPDKEGNVEKMNFGTHFAILRRMGAQYKSRTTGVTHTWMDNLAAPILKTLSRDWDRKMNKRLPLIRKPMMSEYGRVFAEYLNAIQRVIDEKVPLLAACFSNIRPTIENTQRAIENQIGVVLDTLAEDASIVALDVVKTLESKMEPTFQAALAQCGRGCFARRKQILKTQIEDHTTLMCDEMISHLVEGVAETIAKVPARLKYVVAKGPFNVKSQLSLLINNLVENYCSDPAVIAKKIELQNNVRACIDTWEFDWAEKGNYDKHILDMDLNIPATIPEPVFDGTYGTEDKVMEHGS